MLVILLVVSFFLEASCTAVPRFNVKYLGTGYNAIKGDPDEFPDPGFSSTFDVLSFNWANSVLTSDRKYLVPDNIQVRPLTGCTAGSQVTIETGAVTYQNSLSTDVSVEGGVTFGLWDARFTASTGYKTMTERSTWNRRVYTRFKARCIVYEIAANYMDVPINVSSNFVEAVRNLPKEKNDTEYNKFIERYGTHFTNRLYMGSKMFVRSEFDQAGWAKMKFNRVSVSAGAQISYARFFVGGGATVTRDTASMETFSKTRKETFESYIGSRPPLDKSWETWASQSGNSPHPVKYMLTPITQLLNNRFFPSMLSSELVNKSQLLSAAYDIYCKGIPRCGVPPPERPLLIMKKSEANFFGDARIRCPSSYYLLSCGIENNRITENYDLRRMAYPISSTECRCVDTSGSAQCVPWCTNMNAEFKTVQSSLVRGTTSVSCPSGYKVLMLIIKVIFYMATTIFNTRILPLIY